MPYVVPKFIERQPKVVGPLTFRQFIFVGGAAAICFLLYFMLPIYVFPFVAFVLIGGALALVFIKVKGRSLPELLKNSLTFMFSPKVYLWKKSGTSPKIIKTQKKKPKEEKKASPLDVAGRSRLKSLSSKIETGQK